MKSDLMLYRKRYLDIKQNLNKPLIIKGARQVGKTSLVLEFAKEYKQHVYINFEKSSDISKLFETNLDVFQIVKKIELIFSQKITNETLLIFDEIQECPRAITSLKYFCEDMPNLDVIALGSHFGTVFLKENISFPVGKVNELDLYPLDFEEFLINYNKKQYIPMLKEKLKNHEMVEDVFHHELLSLFDLYLIVGGMPEAVSKYIENENINELQQLHQSLFNNYMQDVSKYLKESDVTKVQKIYSNINKILSNDNQKLIAKHIDSKYRLQTIEHPIKYLTYNKLILQLNKVESVNLPLKNNIQENSFKLFYHDIGIFNTISNYNPTLVEQSDDKIYYGSIIESYVIMQVEVLGYDKAYYHKNTSEIDLLIQKENNIIPIEIKSGTNTKSKSLKLYIKNKKPKKAIRISRNNINYNEELKLLDMPVYMTFLL